MFVDYLESIFKANSDKPAIIWNDQYFKYDQLIAMINKASAFIVEHNIQPGDVVALQGDFTPNTIAIMIALIKHRNIIVPLNATLKASEVKKFDIAEVEKIIIVDILLDEYKLEEYHRKAVHLFYQELRERKTAGLVLFTSGTSGEPKAAVHDFEKLLQKFTSLRQAFKTVNFLLFDHWGGLNTLFHTLSNAGVVMATKDRIPEAVCRYIEKYQIELLPVSPSFLNLLILSECYKQYDLSSLKLITYGTEPMPDTTLKRAKQLFNKVTFQQTYGLIELGVLRSKSKSDDSLWVKLGGEGFDLRVVDNILQIKAVSAMLGYLNAPSPFTDDGYFITGDKVETDGEYMKILGRESEIINVGGDKVYPQEVENIILGIDNVLDAVVFGEKHVLVGNIVCARVVLKIPEDEKEAIKRIRMYCKQKLQNFKVPVKIFIEENSLHNERFKKKRSNIN